MDERVKGLYAKFVKNNFFDKALEVLKASYPEDKEGTYDLVRRYRHGLRLWAKVEPQKAMEYMRESYLLTARDVFDDFCIMLEWKRPPDQRFYLPRRKMLYPIVEQLQRLADDKIDVLSVSCPPGIGKALADDTPVLTRNGWKNHGDLAVGDEVIGLGGDFRKVLQVKPKVMLDCLVEFTNGEKIQCHEQHEWMAYCHGDKDRGYFTRETKDFEKLRLQDGGSEKKRGHRYRYQLPPRCIVGEEKDLFSPYFLGVWLGDGTNTAPTITNHESDYAIIEKIHSQGYCERHIYEQQRQPGTKWYNFDIRQELHKYGMCYDGRRTPKHIPEEYLTASIEQRLELLAGLLDTDGTLAGSKYTFTTCDIELRDTFIELLSTFGWRACVTAHPPILSSSGIMGKKDVYCVGFTPDRQIPCALERKRNKEPHKQRKIAFASITRVEPKQGNCITVEGDGMYLVGKTMIPTHNSALATFFQLWLAGRNPEDGMLSCSHNASFLRGLYEEILRELDPDGDYCWNEIFPERRLVRTNALDLKIDIDKAQRFSTFQMASIGAQNAGRVRAIGLLYVDDIVSGIEEALSEDRLQAKWTAFSTDMLQRKQGTCKILMIATRWSVRDPIGRLKMMYQDNDRAVFLTMPALNEKDESNFDYGGKIGFTTKFYHDIRKLMDNASFKALYMNEPVERSGILYPPDELQRFLDLPLEEPDAVLAVCDTKNKGSDYFVMPIAYQYGDKFFVVSFICDNKGPEVVEPRLVDALVKHGVKAARFESNAAGGRIAQNVQEKVKQAGGITKITTKYSTANKETRIIVDSAFVKEHFLFRDPSDYDTDYRVAMNFLCSYAMTSKNKYDDVPDAMSMFASYVQGQATQAAVIMKRFW